MKKELKVKCYIEIIYEDESEFGFYAEVEGKENTIVAELMMITRGTLMAANGVRATCYRADGFEVCAYVK